MSPLEQLMRRVFDADRAAARRLAGSLGLRDVNKAWRHIYRCLRTGRDVHGVAGRLRALPGVDESAFDLALEATRELHRRDTRITELERQVASLQARSEQREAELAAFRPHLLIRGERRVPRPITIFAMTGGESRWRRVDVPAWIEPLSLADRLAHAGRIARRHVADHDGSVLFFGRIVGYDYHDRPDRYYELATDGTVVASHMGRPPQGRAWVGVA